MCYYDYTIFPSYRHTQRFQIDQCTDILLWRYIKTNKT